MSRDGGAAKTPPIIAEIETGVTHWGEPVEEQAVDDDVRTPTTDFLSAVLPELRVEALGRAQMVPVWAEAPGSNSLFFQTLHTAYECHCAFGIRPEVLMFLVNATVAETVRQHPETYRALFTRSSEREVMRIIDDGIWPGKADNRWDVTIGLFEPSLRENVPPGIMQHMLPPLSTHTAESRLASLITFMDAASPFYDYRVWSRCGIPRIVLFGEPADYRAVLAASAQLAEVFAEHLEGYFAALLPVLSTIADEVEAIAGGAAPDRAFWSQIYKHFDESGSDTYAGWASVFVGYVMRIDGRPGAASAKPALRDGFPVFDVKAPPAEEGVLDSGCEPSHVSAVPFIWEVGSAKALEIPMTFAGGLMGVEVQAGALTPELSWAVLQRGAPEGSLPGVDLSRYRWPPSASE